MPFMNEIVDAIPIILSLILIEGLLSVDNALAIASMVSHLPENQKKLALRLGILGAYAFRLIALLLANWIIANQWIKILGAAYLIYLMISHLFFDKKDHAEPHLVARKRGLFATIIQVELMDLSLSFDNVITAVAMSPKLWVVITGVFIGIIALRVLAGYCIKLVEKFTILKKVAFILVGYVGCILLFEIFTHHHVGSFRKFAGIVMIVALSFIIDYFRKQRKLSRR